MTNIIFRRLNVPNGYENRLGMIRAGEEISNYLKVGTNDKEKLVEHLYKTLVEGAGDVEMCLKDPGDVFHVLEPHNNTYKQFTSLSLRNRKVKISVHIDKDDDTGGNLTRNMNVAVPATTQDLLLNGYVGDIVDEIETLAGTLNNKAEIKKYLLANIFLTRCH